MSLMNRIATMRDAKARKQDIPSPLDAEGMNAWHVARWNQEQEIFMRPYIDVIVPMLADVSRSDGFREHLGGNGKVAVSVRPAQVNPRAMHDGQHCAWTCDMVSGDIRIQLRVTGNQPFGLRSNECNINRLTRNRISFVTPAMGINVDPADMAKDVRREVEDYVTRFQPVQAGPGIR